MAGKTNKIFSSAFINCPPKLLTYNLFMILQKIPMCPSVNGLYIPKGNRLIKSQLGEIYDNKIMSYILTHYKQVSDARKFVKDQKMIVVDRYFCFYKKRVISKDHKIKKIDYTNFIKACDDGLAKILDLDDCYFNAGLAERCIVENQKDEQIIIKLSLCDKIRSLNDVLLDLSARP